MTQQRIEQLCPGDQIEIRGRLFDVRSRRERVSPSEGLQDFHVMAVEIDEPLTNHTISRLRVDRTPFKLDVCNGPVHEIAPDEVEAL